MLRVVPPPPLVRAAAAPDCRGVGPSALSLRTGELAIDGSTRVTLKSTKSDVAPPTASIRPSFEIDIAEIGVSARSHVCVASSRCVLVS